MSKKWLWFLVAVIVAAQVSILYQGDRRAGSVTVVFKTPYRDLWPLLPVDTGAFACARIGESGWMCEGSLAIAVLGKGLVIARWGR